MKLIKEILSNPDSISDVLQSQVINDDDFNEKYLNSSMLGVAESHLKWMANNMNESARKLKKLLSENAFDDTTTYELGKCLQLLELDEISLG